MARRKDPYHVVLLKHYDFLDFKGVKVKCTMTKSESGQKVKWTSIRWMRFLKSEPENCLFKYNIDKEEFDQIKPLKKRAASNDQSQCIYKSKL